MMVGALLQGGISTGLLVGGIFGVRHALEADHVVAVAAILDDVDRPARTGAAWGVGHSVPIFLLGVLFLAMNLQIPRGVVTAFELLVACVLVALGLRILLGREALGLAVLGHSHGDTRTIGSDGHAHVSVFGREIGMTHSHADQESIAVGIVHGLAGSGGVVVALAAAAPTVSRGASFLVGFTVASIVTMAVAASALNYGVRRASKLRIAAGVASVILGLVLFAGAMGHGIPVESIGL